MSEDNKPVLETISKPIEKPISSPCVNICCLDDEDICLGCYRSSDEICQWGSMDSEARKEVLKKVAERESDSGNVMKF